MNEFLIGALLLLLTAVMTYKVTAFSYRNAEEDDLIERIVTLRVEKGMRDAIAQDVKAKIERVVQGVNAQA